MISKCCKAKPLFSLGYAHGVKMYDDTYFGVCSKCSEESEFIIEGDDNKRISNRDRYYQGQERELNKLGRSLQSTHEWEFVDDLNLIDPNYIRGVYNNGAKCKKCGRIEWIGDTKMFEVIEGEFPPKKGCIYKEIEEYIQKESEVE